MFLSKKLKRNKFTREEANAIIEKSKKEDPLELEKGDLKAMLIAAFVVFFPFLLFISGGLGLLYWFVFHVWGG